MSLLVIQLPPRDRLAPRAAGPDAASGLRLPAEWAYAYSQDGRSLSQQGRAAAALLPRADSAVLVLADADVSWHRIDVPKAPAARLRAALAGVMEDALLDDEDGTHLALAPQAEGGKPGWVAVTHRPRLAAALAALEAAGLSVARVLPPALPLPAGMTAAQGHFFRLDDDEEQTWLTLASPQGVATVNLGGGLARSLLTGPEGTVRWTATPAAATAAEQWLGASVSVLPEAQRWLDAAQGDANLRQFELAARTRGTRALRDAARRFMSREWRPVRVGLVGLVALQLIGLNAYAWQQRQALAAKRGAMTTLLQATHPGVRTVLDAPVQMARETERLRAAAGRPGDADLEALLAAAAAAWPDGMGPVQTLRFEPGRLSLAAPGWDEAQLAQFRDRLRAGGYQAELADGRVSVARAGGRGAP